MREAFARSGLTLTPAQLMVQRGDRKVVQVEVETGGRTVPVLRREGEGFFKPNTPQEIVEAVRKFM